MSLRFLDRCIAAGALAVLAAAPLAASAPLSASTAASMGADTPQSGFELESLPYPGQALTATLSTGEIVVFDGQNIDVYDEFGFLQQDLATLPSFVFGSFLLVDPTETYVVLGESSNNDILRMNLDGSGTPTVITNLVFNFDAVFADANTLIVSAAVCGFGCGNQIFRVDVPSGSATQLARVTGASGPIALDDHGNLYYATSSAQFPPPDFPTDVIRWDAAQLTGAPVVSESDATLVAGGFEGATDLLFDPAGQALYLAANNFGTGVNVIRQVFGHPANAPILVEGAPFNTISSLELVPASGGAEFLAYQPAGGGRLRYNTTDFVGLYERNALVPRRPQATVTGPGTSGPGQFTVTVTDGPPNGAGLVYYGPSALFDPDETVVDLRVPLFVGLDLSTLERVPGLLQLDASGSGFVDYLNPGGLEGMFAVQVLLLDDLAKIAGMSTAAFL